MKNAGWARGKKMFISVLLLMAAAVFSGCEPAEPDLSGLCDVVRVVDGDTIVVELDGTEEKVRLIGVDTPESVHPDKDKNVPYGEIASEFAKNALEGQQISLEYDVQERDHYGRILAYVWLDDAMFNKTLLEEGHAVVATYPPNVKYVDDFTALQEEAREAGKGLWGDVGTEGEDEGDDAVTTTGGQLNASDAGYIGNRSSKKFHYVDCRSVTSMNADNKVFFSDAASALEAGHDPCGICKPVDEVVSD